MYINYKKDSETFKTWEEYGFHTAAKNNDGETPITIEDLDNCKADN